MKINTDTELLKGEEGIAIVEEKYKAKYVCEGCIRNTSGGWCNTLAAIFYTEEAHPEGSNYFALTHDHNGHFVITNGLSAVVEKDGSPIVYTGREFVDGEIHYSKYRHDYRKDSAGNMVDGGRDYFRSGGSSPIHSMLIEDGVLRIMSPEEIHAAQICEQKRHEEIIKGIDEN